jgi:tryptophan synthase alpha chain
MNRIDARLRQLAEKGQAAFIPFFTAGDPDRETTLRLLREAEGAGADLVELGFPFSDPIADGPVIQASYTRALSRGQRLADVFEMVTSARDRCRLPIVGMVSYSIVFRIGFEEFVRRAVASGLDGATIPDLPIEESERYFPLAESLGFRLVCFITPATTGPRRAAIVRHAGGFIYYISVRGITGERATLPPDLVDNIRQLKAMTQVPVAVGFGVSTPDQVRRVAQVADGVIVGSAIVKLMAEAAGRGADAADAALAFIRSMAAASKASQ